MWPLNSFSEIPDSDQSISDDEELCCSFPKTRASEAATLDKQVRPRLMSQLELLQDLHEADHKRETSSCQKNVGFSSGDEVEMPDFHDEVTCQSSHGFISNSIREAVTCKPDEDFSDDEKGINTVTNSVISGGEGVGKIDTFDVGNGKQIEASAVNEAAGFSTEDHLRKVGGGKTKQRAKFHFLSHKKASTRPLIPEAAHQNSSRGQLSLEGPDTMEYINLGRGSAHMGPYDARKVGLASEHMSTKYSIAELLDGLQEHNRIPYQTSEMCGRIRGRRTHLAGSKHIERIRNDEESCDLVHRGSSSDDELIVTESKKRTIVDQFLEVLGGGSNGASNVLVSSRPSGFGLLGRLQRVVQCEKERDASFLKKLHSKAILGDEVRCINVKILSTSIEGKLTVCSCVCNNNESSHQAENSQDDTSQSTKTIIFSSRVCSNIEIEVGYYILIFPPWNEVQVPGYGPVLLATYFTHS